MLHLLLERMTGFSGTIYATLPNPSKYPNLRKDRRLVWLPGASFLEPNMGLKDALLEKAKSTVQIVLHYGAYTRWDLDLQGQVTYNTLGTLNVVAMFAESPVVESIVCTSSYWGSANIRRVDEIPETVLQDFKAEQELVQILNYHEKARLREWPNAYSYSKNLMERLLQTRYSDKCILLARCPSIAGALVFPSYGFTHADNAAPAIIRAVLSGSTLYSEECKRVINDSVPVDVCCAMILANVVDSARRPMRVINCCSGIRNPTYTYMVLASTSKYRPVTFLPTEEDVRRQLLHRLENGDKEAKLNLLILKHYQFAFTRSIAFEDYQCRAPLLWMSDAEKEKYNIDTTHIDWLKLFEKVADDIVAAGKAEKAAKSKVKKSNL